MPNQKTIQDWNKTRMTAFEARLIELVKKYKGLKNLETRNEIKRKWLNLCNENYAIHRRMVTDYLSGPSIDENLGEREYQRQVGAREYPLFINFINSAEYIFELLYLNSRTFQNELTKNKERSFVNEYITLFLDKGYITHEQESILKGIWAIRNAMHRNNHPRRDIDIIFPDYETGENIEYKVGKGKGIYTPTEGIDKITEALSVVILSVIENIDDLQLSNIKDI